MSILSKIEYRSKKEVHDAILQEYFSKGYAVVSFLYFTNLMKGRLLEGTPQAWQQNYLLALEQSDFLLADGIALQLFTKWSGLGKIAGVLPPNLNGTDFNPYFFDQVLKQYKNVNICLLMFWDEGIGKGEEYSDIAKQKFEDRFGTALQYVWQTPYKNRKDFEFDRDEYEKTLTDEDEVRIVFVCLGTPTQELRIQNHKKKIQQYNCIVLNAGGTIDYITGFEQRAPDRVVKARVLETFRRICANPKKNIKKFLEMFGIIRYWGYRLKKKIL